MNPAEVTQRAGETGATSTANRRPERRWVVPTEDDSVAGSALPLLGGPVGFRAALGRHPFWTPVRVCLVAGLALYAVGWMSKGYCVTHGWGAPQRYMYLCYSDVPLLFESRGLSGGGFPYLATPGPGQELLEYPVLTGYLVYAAAWLTRLFNGHGVMFFAVNAVAMAGLFAWAISSTCRYVRLRPWDGLLLALAPVVALAAFVNWDMLSVALTAASLAAWSRRRPGWSGILLGLATAAKLYPVLLIGPVVLLCLRRGQPKALGRFLGGAVGAWLVVNLPIMLANFEGWARFYQFSRERGMDFGSPWYALSLSGVTIPADAINTLVTVSLLVGLAGVVVLALAAPRPPRLAALAFLSVGVFVLTNKVYSPQYVLWMVPLAVLARPRWRDLLLWQLAEATYFVAIWWYLVGYGTQDKGLHYGGYALAVGVHWLATAWLMGIVVRDALAPVHDPVRADGREENTDDPGGGVLDGAPDRLARRRSETVEPDDLVVAGPG